MAYVFMVRLRVDPVNGKIGVTHLPVKIDPTTIMVDDGGVSDVGSLSRHHTCRLRHHARVIPGGTLDLGLLDQTMTTPLVSFSLVGASFWSK